MRMKINRILCAFLAFLMACSVIASSALTVFADDEEKEASDTTATEGEKNEDGEEGGDGEEEPTDGKKVDYMSHVFASDDEKLETMELELDRYGYELYYESYTGEVAFRNKTTKQVMFTNPIDISTSTNAKKTKQELLSQLVINYSDGDSSQTFFSYNEAAERGQIKMKYIKNGIRVEYTIGEEETRSLVPRMINAEHFEEQILNLITDEKQKKYLTNYFLLKDADSADMTERMKQEMIAQYPITEEMAVYVVGPDTTDREYDKLEQIIKTYCPLFTYEVLEKEHELVGYEGKEDDPPVFKMSLEYYLDEEGLTVRLPANGIRFNESTYSLNYIQVLPWFGCASEEYTGYTFYPDGSGTITRFENLTDLRTLTGQLYGRDYAYHELTGSNNAQTLRMPVFGVVENTKYSEEVQIDTKWVDAYTDSFGDFHEAHEEPVMGTKEWTVDSGYVAIIEEGDALANITSSHGGMKTHKYSTVFTTFYPRPTDSYDLADVISASESSAVSVSSKRKYTGSYKIRYLMLTDDTVAQENNLENYYECSYIGMAKAYREYLERQGTLTRLTDDDVETDIPLYIESFGMVKTSGTFLTFPVTVDTPLTTFDNLKTMYDMLAEKGITNVNFRLNGFANGGMDCTVPNGAEFEKAVGGNDGYAEFVSYAKEKNFGVFPEFDMSYLHTTASFDGFEYKTDAARSIDNRYIQKRVYDPSYQAIMTTGLTLLSSTIFDTYYKNLESDLTELGTIGISLGTLGSDLNSDFYEEDPANREDSKKNVIDVLNKAGQTFGEVMVDGGNAYIFKYVDHILNASLDSSHFTYADEAVPFVGMVLHGYLFFAGAPTNMAGDINYEILKIIENGASPYFTLSSQNTSVLKEDKDLSKYYSVDFRIWYEDVVKYYDELNEALKDVQTSTIVGHEFLTGLRTPTDLEKEYDASELAKAEEDAKLAEQAEKEAAARKDNHNKLMAQLNGEIYIPSGSGTIINIGGDDDVEEEEPVSKYLVDNGLIVRVTYENGIFFILNYNSYEVTVTLDEQQYVIPAISFVKVNP